MAGMLAVFAQWERRMIGQRTKDGLAVKRAQGVRLGRPREMPDSLRRRLRRMRQRGRAGAGAATRAEAAREEARGATSVARGRLLGGASRPHVTSNGRSRESGWRSTISWCGVSAATAKRADHQHGGDRPRLVYATAAAQPFAYAALGRECIIENKVAKAIANGKVGADGGTVWLSRRDAAARLRPIFPRR
jgi:Resolvase, N terminal domain